MKQNNSTSQQYISPSHQNDQAGFSFIEMMAVLVIIGLLGTIVSFTAIRQVQKGRKQTTKANIQNLDSAVRQFKLTTGRYPESLNELVEKPEGMSKDEWGGPYLQHGVIPKDAWDNAFLYEKKDGTFIIKSLGADGKEGGEGENEDITNRSMKKQN